MKLSGSAPLIPRRSRDWPNNTRPASHTRPTFAAITPSSSTSPPCSGWTGSSSPAWKSRQPSRRATQTPRLEGITASPGPGARRRASIAEKAEEKRQPRIPGDCQEASGGPDPRRPCGEGRGWPLSPDGWRWRQNWRQVGAKFGGEGYSQADETGAGAKVSANANGASRADNLGSPPADEEEKRRRPKEMPPVPGASPGGSDVSLALANCVLAPTWR